jgi:hypothetical protein
MPYIIIDADSAECSTNFDTPEQARQFITDNMKSGDVVVYLNKDNYKEDIQPYPTKRFIIAPMEYVDSPDDAELILDTGYCTTLGGVATFKDDLLVSDILESIDTPVKCYDKYETYKREQEQAKIWLATLNDVSAFIEQYITCDEDKELLFRLDEVIEGISKLNEGGK